jgi:hypothetical protein
LTQVAVLRQARDASVAQGLVVATAAVPYGGPVSVLAPPDTVAAPVTMIGDLRVERRGETAVLTGTVLPDRPWVFEARTAVALRTSARFDAATETLTADLGETGLRHAAVWWRGSVYAIGNLPAGRSSRAIAAAGWKRASEIVADDTSSARFFRAPDGQAPGPIARTARPLLIGEWSAHAPGFALPGRRPDAAAAALTLVVIPIDGPAPAAPEQP